MTMEKPKEKPKRRLFRKIKPGTAPGTLTADPQAHPSEIRIIAYGKEEMTEEKITSVEEIPPFLEKWPVTWINVDGLGDTVLIQKLGEQFHLHKLAMEDVVNVHQRAKVEPFVDHLFIIARMLKPGDRLETEQLSLFLGKRFVLTFQETPGDCFDQLRIRIREGRKVLRSGGSDYLAYALLDSVIDHYFPVLESFDGQLDQLEERIMDQPGSEVIGEVHVVRKDLLNMRRAVWPSREAINTLVRSDDALFKKETRIYLRDCYDHTIQVIDMLENLREVTSGLIDLYHSSIGNKMNEIMKVLTLIATIFIPLSFIAGLYGMNFDAESSPWNMPELGLYFGYPMALLIMLIVGVGMLVFFRRKGWLGAPSKNKRDNG
jgi:magnesium transporter